MEFEFTLQTYFSIATYLTVIRMILMKFIKDLKQWHLLIVVSSLSLILSVLSLFIYYDGFKDIKSIEIILGLWLPSTAIVLGIEFGKNVVVNKDKKIKEN